MLSAATTRTTSTGSKSRSRWSAGVSTPTNPTSVTTPSVNVAPENATALAISSVPNPHALHRRTRNDPPVSAANPSVWLMP